MGKQEVNARVAELARELRKAVARAVDKKREVQERHQEAEEEHDQRMADLLDDFDYTEQEISEAAKLNAREHAAYENDELNHAYRLRSHRHQRDVTQNNLLAEVREERAERDAAHRKSVGLREELRGIDSLLANLAGKHSERYQQQVTRAMMVAPLRQLGNEVNSLKEHLLLSEQGEAELQAEGVLGGGFLPAAYSLQEAERLRARAAECELRLASEFYELDMRKESLRNSEFQLQLEKQKARTRGADIVEAEFQAETREKMLYEITSKADELECEEMVLQARNRPLALEVEAITEQYDQQKQKLFCYSMASAREPNSEADEEDEAVLNGGGGIAALIRALARRCGSPQMAFLMLDTRGAGRLKMNDLDVGLLLALRLDYPTITGMSLRAIFTALDRQGLGSVSAGDLNSCCPAEWQAYGHVEPTPREKFLALPRKAIGGAGEASDRTLRDAKATGGSSDGLEWPMFCDILCQQLLGFSEDEAYALFTELADVDKVSRKRFVEASGEKPPGGAR